MRNVGEAVKNRPRMGVESGLFVPAVDGLVDKVPIGIFDLSNVAAVVTGIPSFDEAWVGQRRGFDVVVKVH